MQQVDMQQVEAIKQYLTTLLIGTAIIVVVACAFLYVLKKYQDIKKELREEKEKNLHNQLNEIKDLVKNGKPNSGIYDLTNREKEVLGGILNGKSTNEIAEELYLSRETVKGYRKKIYRKMKVDNVVDLVRSTAGLIE